MAAEAKALLDELMGRSRNLDPSQQPADLKWSDDDVCKYFLCGFCPHELFTNTRADLGSCTKIHDEALRKDYQANPRFERCGYEEDFMRFLNQLINDVEKRIRRGHQRLALNNQQASLNGTSNVNEEKINMLTDRINELVVQAEELGCEGKVEESQGVMKLVDQLKEERHQLETRPSQDDGGPLMKQMEVCDVCGAFLIVGDAPQRQDEHLMGKQHAGYAQVRAEIEKRKKKVTDASDTRDANESRIRLERDEREKERQRERDERRQKERDVERRRDRDRDKDRRRRSRSRSKGRTRERRRSRSRDRKSRDNRSRRSRSRNRDRDRKRSSSRGKRSRRSSSRDRKRDHRSSRDSKSRSRVRSGSRERKDKSKEKDSSRRSSSKDDVKELTSHGDNAERLSPTDANDNSNEHGKDDQAGSKDKLVGANGDENDIPKESDETSLAVEDVQPDKNQANSEGDTKMDE